MSQSTPGRQASIGLRLFLVIVWLAAFVTWATAGVDVDALPGQAGSIARSSVVARRSPCDHAARSRQRYGWPLKPFDRQHPIRGNFGDPRTLTEEAFGRDAPFGAGNFSFHNGIDIAAPTGTPVYPVVSGVVVERHPDEIIVRTDDARTFQYWHLAPRVRPHELVLAGKTVLGTIAHEAGHVHLTEIDGFRVHNPLDPGHLEPYRDHTAPQIEGVFVQSEAGRTLHPGRLHGPVLIDAEASDEPSIPVPGAWFGFPVTPATVAWRMTTLSGGVVVPLTRVADFRTSEPPNRRFWRIYAAGTYQNFPVFADRYFWHTPGRYLFNLTPRPLDTRRLANGAYRITVQATDVCGNRASLAVTLRIDNPHRKASARIPRDKSGRERVQGTAGGQLIA